MSSSSGSGSGESWARHPCAACLHFRPRCQPSCVYAPYFPSPAYDDVFNPTNPLGRFRAVHRAFGAGYVACALQGMPPETGEVAVDLLVRWARDHPDRSNVVDLQSFNDFKAELARATEQFKQQQAAAAAAAEILYGGAENGRD